MLDAITADKEQKQRLLQGEVIDKAERLSKQCHLLLHVLLKYLSRTSSANTRKTRTV